MTPLEELLRLLAATADDRWQPGHPTTRPYVFPEDRAHDAARPADPTADTVADPARLRLASAWRAAMDYVWFLVSAPAPIRHLVIEVCEEMIVDHILALRAAHDHWAGRA